MQRWGTAAVAAVSAAVAAVVSVATTLVVLQVTDTDGGAVRPQTLTGTAGASGPVVVAGTFDLAGLFARVSTGVVRIETTACVRGGAGSGFLVAPELVATAAHVVDGAHAIVLRRDDGTGVEGAVVGIDTVHDVALVRADRALTGHVFILAAGLPSIGAEVAALGYPLAGPLVPVRRTVSGLDQSLKVTGSAGGSASGGSDADSETVVGDLIRVDGGFESGVSGGPLLAADGRVVGLVEGRSLAAGSSGFAVAAVQAAPLLTGWRSLTKPIDVSDACTAPVGPPQSRVVVRDESGSGLGGLVAAFFGAYASAINSGRYQEAWGMLTPTARAGRTLAEWTEAERSSQLFDAVVREVTVVAAGTAPTTGPAGTGATGPASSTRPAGGGSTSAAHGATSTSGPAATGSTSPAPVVTPGTGGRLDAVLEFSSTQQDRLGPGGQTCSRWRLTYTLVRSGPRWRIDAAVLGTGYPQSC